MFTGSGMPREMRETCEAWGSALEEIEDESRRLDFIERRLGLLLKNSGLFHTILTNIANGADYPDIRRSTLFKNEIILFRHPQRLFSLRLLLAAPGEYTPIHDHNAWGVISALVGKVDAITYERLDNGSREMHARLQEKARRVLEPGQVMRLLPLYEGIHRTGNAGERVMAMVSVYGPPLGRPYILGYDPDRNRAYRMYSPRKGKQVLAGQVLAECF